MSIFWAEGMDEMDGTGRYIPTGHDPTIRPLQKIGRRRDRCWSMFTRLSGRARYRKAKRMTQQDLRKFGGVNFLDILGWMNT